MNNLFIGCIISSLQQTEYYDPYVIGYIISRCSKRSFHIFFLSFSMSMLLISIFLIISIFLWLSIIHCEHITHRLHFKFSFKSFLQLYTSIILTEFPSNIYTSINILINIKEILGYTNSEITILLSHTSKLSPDLNTEPKLVKLVLKRP
jgi:hypothetical protein